MNTVTIFVLVIVIPFAFVYGQVETSDASTQSNEWDFIVIGAGASGSVVAGRLAEETKQRILLLEGGALGTGQRDVGGDDYVGSSFKTDPATGNQKRDKSLTRYDVPLMADSIRMAPLELQNMWNITAIGYFFAQAKVVGGNQATNVLLWSMPQKIDFDKWNLSDYTAAKMWPYLKRIENATQTGLVNPLDRGYSGRTNIKFASFVTAETNKFISAATAAGFPVGVDQYDGTLEVGTYLSQTNVKNGIRQSSSILYLAPLLKKKQPNLEFRTSAVVTRILFDSSNNTNGVEYYDEEKCAYKKVYASKEVIIAAGALQTAKILFNSGIGPKSVLKAFGKTPRVENEIIGQKIRNHLRVSMQYTDASIVNANVFFYPAASIQHARTGEGILEGNARAFLNFNSGYGSTPYPDIQAIPGMLAGLTPTNPYSQGFAVTVGLAHNIYANGTLNLTSTNPLESTLFNANLFVVQEDAERVARGILKVREVMAHYNGSVETAPGKNYTTIKQLVTWIRSPAIAASTCHYYGSVPMGKAAPFPADTEMLVRGVQRLRIVGPAVIPAMVYPGMQPLAVALGEKGTDLIKLKHGL